MIILGLNCFHGDSSAAIVRNGTLVAAAEEESFRRIKHWAGFPAQAIAYCLAEAGISLADVDHVAVDQDSRANLVGKLRYVLSQRPILLWSRWRIRRARISTTSLLQVKCQSPAHLSSAFHVSPFE
jgi:carbamoyltransferase